MKWELVKVVAWFVWLVLSMPLKLRKFRGCTQFDEKRKHEYIIDQFKPLILACGILLSRVIPDPSTDKYIRHRSTEALIELRDEYFKHETLDVERIIPFKAIANLIILVQEYNSCYAQRLSWIRREWNKLEWDAEMPQRNWE